MRHDEDRMQKAVVEYCRVQWPWLLFTCAPATSKSAREGAQKKLMGYYKGWPDLFFADPRGKFHGLFIEFKTESGKISKEQVQVLTNLQMLGYKVEVCRSHNEAINILTKYLGR